MEDSSPLLVADSQSLLVLNRQDLVSTLKRTTLYSAHGAIQQGLRSTLPLPTIQELQLALQKTEELYLTSIYKLQGQHSNLDAASLVELRLPSNGFFLHLFAYVLYSVPLSQVRLHSLGTELFLLSSLWIKQEHILTTRKHRVRAYSNSR